MHLSRHRGVLLALVACALVALAALTVPTSRAITVESAALPVLSEQVSEYKADSRAVGANGAPTPKPVSSFASEWLALPSGGVAGADAAPSAQFYDSGDAAKQLYLAWWEYEQQIPQDRRDAQTLYIDGIGVCAARARGAGMTAIEDTWAKEFGYTKSGAAAIAKAALVALCPQYNSGYQTYFDLNVITFSQYVQIYVTFTRPYNAPIEQYEFGAFMKETCGALNSPLVGGTGIYDHMNRLMQQGYFSLVKPPVDSQIVKIMINEATKAGCDGLRLRLPPVIQMAS